MARKDQLGYVGTPGAPKEGRPAFYDHLIIPAPAAGARAAFKLDSTWNWRILSARFSLTTSAVAGNRAVTVDYCDPEGNVWVRNGAAVTFPANTNAQEFSFVHGGSPSSGAAGADVYARLADLWIPGGWQVQINVAAIDVADQLTLTRLYVEKLVAS